MVKSLFSISGRDRTINRRHCSQEHSGEVLRRTVTLGAVKYGDGLFRKWTEPPSLEAFKNWLDKARPGMMLFLVLQSVVPHEAGCTRQVPNAPCSPVQLSVSSSGLCLALAMYWLAFCAGTLAFAHLGPVSLFSYEQAAGLDFFFTFFFCSCKYF